MLRDLCQLSGANGQSSRLPEGYDPKAMRDLYERFIVWAASLGALQKGHASLDSRISDDDLTSEVLRLLRRLKFFASECLYPLECRYCGLIWLVSPILDGSREQLTWVSEPLSATPSSTECFGDLGDGSLLDYSSDGDDNHAESTKAEVVNESNDICMSIDVAITSLMRLSMQVHLSTKRGKFARCPLTSTHDVEPDINHMREIFPWASSNQPFVRKMGRANSQRRVWLLYRRSHNDKLSLDKISTHIVPTTQVQGGPTSMDLTTIEESFPSPTDTKATTFQFQLQRAGTSYHAVAQSEYPETFFGKSSLAAEDEPEVLIPRSPVGVASGRPFQCPYCHEIVEISSKNAWLLVSNT